MRSFNVRPSLGQLNLAWHFFFQQRQSLSFHFWTSPPSLNSQKSSRTSSCKSEGCFSVSTLSHHCSSDRPSEIKSVTSLPFDFSLKTNYTEDSLTWDFMAKRELEAPGAGEELHTAKGRASDINRREERCCQVYEEGVKSINTGWPPLLLRDW